MTPNLSLDPVISVNNDAHAQTGQNSKTVECRLKATYLKLARTEANIFMFTKLKAMNLATNDVTSFVEKQTIHRKDGALSLLYLQRTIAVILYHVLFYPYDFLRTQQSQGE